jgi:hypothetical protein
MGRWFFVTVRRTRCLFQVVWYTAVYVSPRGVSWDYDWIKWEFNGPLCVPFVILLQWHQRAPCITIKIWHVRGQQNMMIYAWGLCFLEALLWSASEYFEFVPNLKFVCSGLLLQLNRCMSTNGKLYGFLTTLASVTAFIQGKKQISKAYVADCLGCNIGLCIENKFGLTVGIESKFLSGVCCHTGTISWTSCWLMSFFKEHAYYRWLVECTPSDIQQLKSNVDWNDSWCWVGGRYAYVIWLLHLLYQGCFNVGLDYSVVFRNYS